MTGLAIVDLGLKLALREIGFAFDLVLGLRRCTGCDGKNRY
jgi:hypothetical protein